MKWNDPIVKKTRKLRDLYARKFNYNLKLIFEDLKEKERGRNLEYKKGIEHLEAINWKIKFKSNFIIK